MDRIKTIIIETSDVARTLPGGICVALGIIIGAIIA